MRSDSAVFITCAGPTALDEIEAALEQSWCGNGHVPHDIRLQVGIAVSEIAGNIVEHACGGRPVQIRMEIRALPREVWVEFADDGDPAQVDLSDVGLPEDMAEDGRGLALAQAVLARLSYRRGDWNHWTLVSKRFG